MNIGLNGVNVPNVPVFSLELYLRFLKGLRGGYYSAANQIRHVLNFWNKTTANSTCP